MVSVNVLPSDLGGGAQYPPTGWCDRHQGHPLSAIAMTTGKGLWGGYDLKCIISGNVHLNAFGGVSNPPYCMG